MEEFLRLLKSYSSEISALTALVAVIVGPMLGLYVANREIKANTTAVNRQQWINSLRDELANYLAQTSTMAMAVNCGIQNIEDIQEKFECIVRSQMKIELLLNPNELDHVEIMNLLAQASATASNPQKATHKALSDFTKLIVLKSQAVLKKEWIRVKKLK